MAEKENTEETMMDDVMALFGNEDANETEISTTTTTTTTNITTTTNGGKVKSAYDKYLEEFEKRTNNPEFLSKNEKNKNWRKRNMKMHVTEQMRIQAKANGGFINYNEDMMDFDSDDDEEDEDEFP